MISARRLVRLCRFDVVADLCRDFATKSWNARAAILTSWVVSRSPSQQLEQLYVRHSRNVFRRARELLGDDDAARDATQEVFMRVLRIGGNVPSEPTPTAWLHRTTTNLCLNRLRDRRRRQEILTSAYAPALMGAGAAAAPPIGEPRAIVLDILDRIPEELQDVAVYALLDELTYEEIARLLGVSKRTVCNRLAAFREMVGRLYPDLRWAS
jgi:RNA polymerase sigma-70 factor (ECF subfamily)